MTIEKNIITKITGRAVPLGGDDIDTDRIIPARYLLCTTFKGLGENAFADDKNESGHPFSDSKYKDATILLTGRNFGCGSSREHAPQALRRWGVQAIVAESFAEIFLDNSRACGIVCVRLQRTLLDGLINDVKKNPQLELTVDVKDLLLKREAGELDLEMDSAIRQRFLDGTWDVLSLLLSASSETEDVLGKLPYLNFSTRK